MCISLNEPHDRMGEEGGFVANALHCEGAIGTSHSIRSPQQKLTESSMDLYSTRVPSGLADSIRGRHAPLPRNVQFCAPLSMGS